jgi:MFS family permease
VRHLLVDVSPLRKHREFRLLWFAVAVTFFGSMVTYVAIPFQVYELTHSSWLVGLLGAVEFVAILTMALVGGALADAIDRRLMVRVTEATLMCLVGLLALNALLDHPSVVLVFAVAGLLMAVDSLQRPSLDALLPRLVPREDVTAAGALNVFRTQIGMIAGPAVGGVLIASVGLTATYVLDVASFAVSLVLLARMKAVPPAEDAAPPSLKGVAEGLRYARSRPELMGTYLVDMNAMFFGMPNALFPQLASAYGGASVLGLMYAAPSVGSLVATLTSGWTKQVRRQGLAILWAAALWGVALVLFALSPWLSVALLFLGLAGAADMISGLFRMTIWNTTIPDHLRGRLAGIELIGYGSGPTLGNVEAGGVAALTTPRWSAGIGGVLCVAGTAALAVALPEFRRYTVEPAARSGRPEEDPAASHVGLLEHDPD